MKGCSSSERRVVVENVKQYFEFYFMFYDAEKTQKDYVFDIFEKDRKLGVKFSCLPGRLLH